MKKIKNHPHFLFLLILLLMLSCNTKNSETTKVVSEVRPEISANDYKSGKWLEQQPIIKRSKFSLQKAFRTPGF